MTSKNMDTIYAHEREDWDRNAAFYRRDERSPLMRLLAIQRECFYGIRPGQRVLDLGCGAGGTVAELRSRGVDAVGIDFSPLMIEAAIQGHQLHNYVSCAEAADLPFETNSFEVVIADVVLQHLAFQARLGDAFRDVNRVLRPDGQLCCFDRNGSLVSRTLLRLSIGVKELIRLATGGLRYPSSATRNEIPFGGRRDMETMGLCGFQLKHRRGIATAPFFMSVVALNTLQYFLSERLRAFIEPRICRLLGWLEPHCAWDRLCVEQLAVFEARPYPRSDDANATYTDAPATAAFPGLSPAVP